MQSMEVLKGFDVWLSFLKHLHTLTNYKAVTFPGANKSQNDPQNLLEKLSTPPNALLACQPIPNLSGPVFKMMKILPLRNFSTYCVPPPVHYNPRDSVLPLLLTATTNWPSAVAKQEKLIFLLRLELPQINFISCRQEVRVRDIMVFYVLRCFVLAAIVMSLLLLPKPLVFLQGETPGLFVILTVVSWAADCPLPMEAADVGA